MCTLVVQTEEEFQQLTEIEKEEAVVLTMTQKEIKQLIEGLSRIWLHNKKERQIYRRKWVELADRSNILHKTRLQWIRQEYI